MARETWAPVLALLRKDWAVFRPLHRAAVAGVFVLAVLQTIRSDEAMLWLGVFLVGALVVYVPGIEWRLDADRLVASLPVDRRSVVLERYATVVIAGVVAWAAWTVAGRIAGQVFDPARSTPGIWATLSGTLTLASLAGLLLAAFLPLHFRLGLGRAATGFPLLALLLVTVARGVARWAAPTVAVNSELPALLTPPGATIEAAMAALVARVGPVGAAALVAAGVAVLLGGSAAISVRAFRRRSL